MRRWQVETGLIYGQVKKSYRRRKLVRVSQVMRQGTEATLKAALQELGFSGRLNTAFIERVNLTVRYGVPALARRTWATSQQSPHLLAPAVSGGAPIITDIASSPLTAGEARTAVRARGKVDGTPLPATDAGDGSRKNHPTMDDRRGALVPLTKGVCLRGIQTRWRCSLMLRADGRRCSQKHAGGAKHGEEKACLDCLITKNRPEGGLERAQ